MNVYAYLSIYDSVIWTIKYVRKFIFANKKIRKKYMEELKLKIQTDFDQKIKKLVYNYCQ